jgi:DNA (cytosine-5)-methyltransferase 1
MRPIIVDSFAGGGGASTGIEMALGRSPDIAINHNAAALAMHEVNHPGTLHLSKNIWQVDPLEAVGNRPVGLAWFSPDCKHFSKAKGGKPVKRNVRDLAWTVVLWAKRARPAIIILENVEEFQDWGPLLYSEDGTCKPCPDRRGETFKEWVGQLKRLGYKVEFRQLVAADYGAPTTRKRLFLIARRDGQKIVWPAPTHGKPSNPDVVAGRKLPWRTAAEIIDWSLPCPSIFETSEEIMAKHGLRAVRPLADATMARVARGVKRYVLDAAKPYIVKFQTGSTGSPIDAPLPTVTANSFHKRPGGAAPVELVVPLMTAAQHGGANRGADEPMRTIAASDKDQHGVVAAMLVQSGYGERKGQEPRALDIEAPLGTVVAGGVKHAVVAAHLSRKVGASGETASLAPAATEVCKGELVATFMAQHNNDSRRAAGVNPGQSADRPLSTITSSGSQQGVVAAHLSHLYTSNTAGGQGGVEHPLKTVTAGGGHAALVAAFMVKYYGTGGQDQNIDDPMHTLTVKARMGLVTVDIAGEPYAITHIGMRMLTPRELFSAQGFPPHYQIDGIAYDGRVLTKSEQISCVGNSVCPPLAAALVAANAGHLSEQTFQEAAE